MTPSTHGRNQSRSCLVPMKPWSSLEQTKWPQRRPSDQRFFFLVIQYTNSIQNSRVCCSYTTNFYDNMENPYEPGFSWSLGHCFQLSQLWNQHVLMQRFRTKLHKFRVDAEGFCFPDIGRSVLVCLWRSSHNANLHWMYWFNVVTMNKSWEFLGPVGLSFREMSWSQCPS